MSHTTTISNLVFADIPALQAAADELRNRGISCDLLENEIPRAYYSSQLPQAAAVLKLNDSRYDVGFYQEDGVDGLTPKCDLWGGDIAKQIGAPTEEGVGANEAALGKLRNAYATAQVTNQALQSGASVDRINNDDGSVQLVVRAA